METDFKKQKREDVKAQLLDIVERFPVLKEELDLESTYSARLVNKACGFYYSAVDTINVDLDNNRVHLFISSDNGFNMSIFKDLGGKN